MGKVSGAKHAAPARTGRGKHARHAKQPLGPSRLQWAIGGASATLAIALAAVVLPAFNGAQGVSAEADAAAGAASASIEMVATQKTNIETGQGVASPDDSEGNSHGDAQGDPQGVSANNQTNAVNAEFAVAESASDDAGQSDEPSSAEAPKASYSTVDSATQQASADESAAASELASDAVAPAAEASDEPAELRAGAAEQSAGAVTDEVIDAETQSGALGAVTADEASSKDEGGEGSESGQSLQPVAVLTALAAAEASQTSSSDDADADSGPVAIASLDLRFVPYAGDVEPLMQQNLLDNGCEVVSLAIALRSMGIDADPLVIADDYLDYEGGMAAGYVGSPYEGGAGFPAGIAKAANAYLSDSNLDYHAYELTGSSFNDIEELVRYGYPVLVWTTIDFDEPYLWGFYDGDYEWYGNEHCVVVYGINGDNLLVSDPNEGLVKRDAQKFAEIYEKCGSMALVVL